MGRNIRQVSVVSLLVTALLAVPRFAVGMQGNETIGLAANHGCTPTAASSGHDLTLTTLSCSQENSGFDMEIQFMSGDASCMQYLREDLSEATISEGSFTEQCAQKSQDVATGLPSWDFKIRTVMVHSVAKYSIPLDSVITVVYDPETSAVVSFDTKVAENTNGIEEVLSSEMTIVLIGGGEERAYGDALHFELALSEFHGFYPRLSAFVICPGGVDISSDRCMTSFSNYAAQSGYEQTIQVQPNYPSERLTTIFTWLVQGQGWLDEEVLTIHAFADIAEINEASDDDSGRRLAEHTRVQASTTVKITKVDQTEAQQAKGDEEFDALPESGHGGMTSAVGAIIACVGVSAIGLALVLARRKPASLERPVTTEAPAAQEQLDAKV